jgi:hypothetical protein
LVNPKGGERRRVHRSRLEKCGGKFSNDGFLAKLGLSSYFPFRVVDCSPTGMKEAARRPLDRAQRFVFTFPAAQGEHVKVAGSIVWTEPFRERSEKSDTSQSGWLGGVRFDPLHPNVENRLLRHIQRFAEDALRIRKPRLVRYYGKGDN